MTEKEKKLNRRMFELCKKVSDDKAKKSREAMRQAYLRRTK